MNALLIRFHEYQAETNGPFPCAQNGNVSVQEKVYDELVGITPKKQRSDSEARDRVSRRKMADDVVLQDDIGETSGDAILASKQRF
jgi:hypothetical protein